MSFNSAIVDKNVKDAIQPSTSSEHGISGPIVPISSTVTAMVAPSMQAYTSEQPQQVNLLDLDLMVPPIAGQFSFCFLCPNRFVFSILLIGTSCYVYNEESSDEDEDANECLLQL